MDRPETKYAWNGETSLAYQVIGDGPIDLVYLQGFFSNVDLNWESPKLAHFLRRLSGLGRLIVMDKRGWGCSERFSPTDVPPFESLTDDLLAVMEAAGSERAAIFAHFECTTMAMLFAATHPEMVSSLILCDPLPVWIRTEETPWLYDEAQWEAELEEIHDQWGTPEWFEGLSYSRDPVERDWYLRMMRATMTPGAMAAEFRRYMATDVRDILPSIHVPTLVLSMLEDVDRFTHEGLARLTAAGIPGAKLADTGSAPAGSSWFPWNARSESILKEVEGFLAERREEEASFDRVLATVLFTDIVDSTATAATMGDAKWKKLVDDHDHLAKATVARFRGAFVRGTGDGMLATFDGPARGVKCAQAFVESVKSLGIEARAGLHTGEIEYGGNDLAGVGVHIGARVGSAAGPSEVWVSSTVKDLTAGSGLSFEDAGEHELKGVPDRWHLYRVVGG